MTDCVGDCGFSDATCAKREGRSAKCEQAWVGSGPISARQPDNKALALEAFEC